MTDKLQKNRQLLYKFQDTYKTHSVQSNGRRKRLKLQSSPIAVAAAHFVLAYGRIITSLPF